MKDKMLNKKVTYTIALIILMFIVPLGIVGAVYGTDSVAFKGLSGGLLAFGIINFITLACMAILNVWDIT